MPLVGSIGIAAFSYENSSTSDEKYTRNTCPFQVLRHSEESMEFDSFTVDNKNMIRTTYGVSGRNKKFDVNLVQYGKV